MTLTAFNQLSKEDQYTYVLQQPVVYEEFSPYWSHLYQIIQAPLFYIELVYEVSEDNCREVHTIIGFEDTERLWDYIIEIDISELLDRLP
jgi:hypothetical protein